MLFLALLVLLVGFDDGLAVKAEQAKQAMAARDFDRVIALYRDLNRAVPGDRAVQQNFGLALYSAGRYAESITVLGQVLRADPDSPPALLFSGLDWARLDQPRRAVPLLTRFLAGSG